MEKRYRCTSCNTFFVNPYFFDGMFTCPSCNEPNFETVECKKYMHDCFV
jgi:hypothetical protein